MRTTLSRAGFLGFTMRVQSKLDGSFVFLNPVTRTINECERFCFCN